MVKVKRIYEPADDADGARYLVDRLWPRGVTRQGARLTGWLKDLAPSPALRRWYGHELTRWVEFQRRYKAELRAPEKQRTLRDVAAQARRGRVTLLFAARDTEHNSALVLKRLIDERLTLRSSARG
jgi:uncharacterized protein YeaO (DUF488 family)